MGLRGKIKDLDQSICHDCKAKWTRWVEWPISAPMSYGLILILNQPNEARTHHIPLYYFYQSVLALELGM